MLGEMIIIYGRPILHLWFLISSSPFLPAALRTAQAAGI